MQVAAAAGSGGGFLSAAAKPTLVLLGLCLALTPLAVNAGMLALALGTLFAIMLLLWQAEGPPALLVICSVQWLQGALEVLHAEYRREPLWTMSLSRSVDQACALTMLWALALAVGMRIALLRVKLDTSEFKVGVRVALIVYLAWSAMVSLAAVLLPASAWQVAVSLGELRWASVYVLYVVVLRGRRGWTVLAVSLLIEVALGFLSFFSNFKTVLVVLLTALLSSNYRLRIGQYAGAVATLAFTVYLGVLWSAIKTEYRQSLSGGTDEQVTVIDRDEQVAELQRLVGDVDQSMFGQGVERLVERIAYVDYFAYTIDFVPRTRGHEGGRMWWAAVEHVVKPRIFFPDKAPLPADTEVAERYTGMMLTGNRTGTSISIGLPAETYVDFGVPGMFWPALLLGVMYGLAFRVLMTRSRYQPYGAGLMVAIAVTHMMLGSSAAKTVGSLLTLCIVAVLIWFAVLPRLLEFAVRIAAIRRTPRVLPPVQSRGVSRSWTAKP